MATAASDDPPTIHKGVEVQLWSTFARVLRPAIERTRDRHAVELRTTRATFEKIQAAPVPAGERYRKTVVCEMFALHLACLEASERIYRMMLLLDMSAYRDDLERFKTICYELGERCEELSGEGTMPEGDFLVIANETKRELEHYESRYDELRQFASVKARMEARLRSDASLPPLELSAEAQHAICEDWPHDQKTRRQGEEGMCDDRGSVPTTRVVFVLGGSGSGKGTQCERIAARFGRVHLSAGELIRNARATDPARATVIDRHLARGELVPSEVTVGLLRDAMELATTQRGARDFVIDGFPRSVENVVRFERDLGSTHTLEFALWFECSSDTRRRRLGTRARQDDTAGMIEKRFATDLQMAPVLEAFERLGRLRRVDAEPTPDDVFEDVAKWFA